MKIELKKIINTIYGEPIKQNEKEVTLGFVCAEALMTVTAGDAKIEAIEKYKRYKLAERVATADEIDLESEDITKIKECIGKVYGPNVVGPSFDMLEGKK